MEPHEQEEWDRLLWKLKHLPQHEQEKIVVEIIGTALNEMPIEAILDAQSQIQSNHSIANHPVSTMVLDMIEGQLAIRAMKDDGE